MAVGNASFTEEYDIEIESAVEAVSVADANRAYQEFYNKYTKGAIEKINAILLGIRYMPGVEITIQKGQYVPNQSSYSLGDLSRMQHDIKRLFEMPDKGWSVKIQTKGDLIFNGSRE